MLDTALFPEFDCKTEPGAILGWINETVDTVNFEALDAGIFHSSGDVRCEDKMLPKWSTLGSYHNELSIYQDQRAGPPKYAIYRVTDPTVPTDLHSILIGAGYEACLHAQAPCGNKQYCRVDLFVGRLNELSLFKSKAKILSAQMATFRMIEQGYLNRSSSMTDQLLSNREIEALTWTAEGKTTWETAQIVNLSESTINFHLRRAMKKLNAANKCNAAAIAIARGLISVRQ